MNEEIKKLYDNPNFSHIEAKPSQSSFDNNISQLGYNVAFGEGEHLHYDAKPGNYLVMRATREGFDEKTLVYVHEDVWTTQYQHDMNLLMDDIQLIDVGGVDGGTYGVSYGENPNHDWYANIYDIHSTNNGDGYFALYTNNDQSVFVLDDEDIVTGVLHKRFDELIGLDADKYACDFNIDNGELMFEFYRDDTNDKIKNEFNHLRANLCPKP